MDGQCNLIRMLVHSIMAIQFLSCSLPDEFSLCFRSSVAMAIPVHSYVLHSLVASDMGEHLSNEFSYPALLYNEIPSPKLPLALK